MPRSITRIGRCARGRHLAPAVAALLALLCAPLCAADPAAESSTRTALSIPLPADASVSAESKLDPELLLAVRQNRGEPPFDKAAATSPQLQPDIPIRDASGVLVDVTGALSDELLKHIASIGGRFAPSPDPARVARAMIPLGALEALAGRTDVSHIGVARLERFSRIEHDPKAPGGFATPKP